MSLCQACSEGESFENIRLFEIWEVGQQLFDGATACHRPNDHADGHAHTPDAWLAAHDLWIHRYAVELLHVVMTAQRAREVRLGEGPRGFGGAKRVSRS